MVAIEKTTTFPADPDQVWALVSDGGEWASWMVDEADIDVAPGSSGTVVDDDERRVVAIDEVDDIERRVQFRWWPTGDRTAATTVTLVVEPCETGSRLVVIEAPVMVPVMPVSASVSAFATMRLSMRLASTVVA
jgi:uncharacterized protein YndB with AHSA1/START domain